jgi:hypothetical protein
MARRPNRTYFLGTLGLGVVRFDTPSNQAGHPASLYLNPIQEVLRIAKFICSSSTRGKPSLYHDLFGLARAFH